MVFIKCWLTVRISTGIGVSRRCLYRMLISLTGMRTAKHTKEMSSSAMLVWGRFSITDARVLTYKRKWWIRNPQPPLVQDQFSVFNSNTISKNLSTLKREKVPVWRESRRPSMLCSCETVTWNAAALVKALTMGSDKYVERNPNWRPNIQSCSTKRQQIT